MFNYSELVNEAIKEHYVHEEQTLMDMEIPNEDFRIITDYIDYEGRLKKLLSDIEGSNASDVSIDMEDRIRDSFSSQVNEYNAELSRLIIGHKQNKTRVIEKKEQQIKQAKADLEDYIAREKEKLKKTVNRHKSIVSRRGEIETIFSLYGIPINNVSIDLEAMSLEELVKVIDSSNYILDEILQSPKIINKVVSLLYLPATKKFKNKTQEANYKIVWFICFIVLTLFTKGTVLAVFGVFYVFNMFINILDIQKRKHALELAYSITNDVDFDKFYIMAQEYRDLTKAVADAEAIDIQPELDRLTAEYNAEMLKIQEKDPSGDIQELLDNYRKYVSGSSVVSVIDSYKQVYLNIKESKISDCKRELERVHNIIVNHISNYNYLGKKVEESKILTNYSKCGAIYYDGQIVSEKQITFPYRSTLFTFKNSEQKAEVISYMKLLLLNHLCNVNPTNTFITVVDEIEGGAPMIEFLKKEYSRFTKLVTEKPQETFDKYVEVMNANVIRAGGHTINDYNKIAVEDGKLLVTYDICIVLNTTQELLNNQVFKKRIETSHERGVVYWILNDESLVDFNDENTVKQLIEQKRGIQEVVGYNKINSFRGGEVNIDMEDYEDYKYDINLCTKVLDMLADYCKSAKGDVLDYETGFRQKYIPDDKIWTYDTIDGIEVNFGLEDGDPDKPNTIKFGDKNVHAISVGMTGAGKSGMINATIASLVHKYPPEWLEMVMIDFKNIEFAKYTGQYCLPHAKIISGTKDGAYSLSVFDYLIAEQKRRTAIIKAKGYDKSSDYNKCVIREGRYDLVMPRILCVFDEFQAMFNQVETKILDKITTKMAQITKEARFVGIHFWFTSQSMTGTLSGDLLGNFNLRTALRCKKEVSESVLGNNAAGTISENVMGWMYTNQSAGENENSNQLWRIPWADSDYMKVYLTRLNDKCKNEINPHTGKHWLHRHADFYNEDELFGKDKLDDWLTREQLQDPRTFVLGERMMYSTRRSPINTSIFRGENENIIFNSFERDSMINMANTFIENLLLKNASFVVNVCDDDTRTLMGLDERLPEDTREFLDYSGREIMDYMYDCIEYREQIPKDELTPAYIIGINWERLEGFGRNNYRTKDEWTKIIRLANSVDVHLITCVTQYTEIRSSFETLYMHKLGSYMSDKESYYITGDSRMCQVKKEHAMYVYGSNENKFKLYQFPAFGEVKEREVVF